ncbi:MAG TPA: respiratory nitrate reductase subunit gamma [Streptosporangiaceae bacterium]|nr:respiratory nitrate reductase subunit gamma [Streptosporangiaceae bacterium]
MKIFLWIVFPYICLTSFVIGHIWRYRYDKFGWTSRSSELYEKKILAWASPLFHFGILGVLAGHLAGLLVPESWTSAVGVSEHAYHLVAVTLGTLAGLATITGFVLLIYRRRMTPSVLRVTSVVDKAMYPVLGGVILLGLVNTIGIGLLGLGGHPGGYNYRTTVAVWFRDVLLFHPGVTQMAGAPWSFQLHAVLAFLLLAAWPFTRLVHVLAAPFGYAFRPYIVYRTRQPLGAARAPRRGWERADQRAGTQARAGRR